MDIGRTSATTVRVVSAAIVFLALGLASVALLAVCAMQGRGAWIDVLVWGAYPVAIAAGSMGVWTVWRAPAPGLAWRRAMLGVRWSLILIAVAICVSLFFTGLGLRMPDNPTDGHMLGTTVHWFVVGLVIAGVVGAIRGIILLIDRATPSA